MLHDDYLSVLNVRTKAELEVEVVRFAKRLEFNTVALTLVVDQPGGDSEFFNVDNTPAGYRPYFLDRDIGRRDPVAQHCKQSSIPITWDQSTYVEGGCPGVWDIQAQFGYRFGISTAMHLPGGLHVMVGIDRDLPLPSCSRRRMRMAADLQLFAAYAHQAAVRLLRPTASKPSLPALTMRELECLRWTMEGKTAWEIGRILHIAENTVTRHTYAATRKLGCTGKHHSVVKALKLGLIS